MTNKTRQELIKLALLGTDRGNFETATLEQFQQLGIDTSLPPSEIVLQAAAMYASMQKAGFQPKTYTEPLPNRAPIDNTPVCSSKSIQHLTTILNQTQRNYDDILKEFVEILGKVNKRLPEEKLPEIFLKAEKNKKLWQYLESVVGTRGKWLADQNPTWKLGFYKPNIEDWDIGTLDERKELLRHTRKTNPSKALELVQSTWEEDGWREKVAFLKILNTNISIADEGFLESCLDARQKEIRKTAAQLLSKIDGSALVNRMFERVKPLIIIKNRRLDLHLPEALDEATIRDGIDPRSQWFKGGVKASRLGQMMAIIPPKHWEKHFKLSPQKLLRKFVTSDWKELLLQAISESIMLHKDDTWAEAFLHYWLDHYTEPYWKKLNLVPLIESLSPKVVNTIAIKGFKSAKTLIDEEHPVTLILKNSEHQWSSQLTKELLKNLRNWLNKENTRYWSSWHFKNILKKAAFKSDPQLAQFASAGWPEDSRNWSAWERDVDEFIQILSFRKTMIENLKK